MAKQAGFGFISVFPDLIYVCFIDKDNMIIPVFLKEDQG